MFLMNPQCAPRFRHATHHVNGYHETIAKVAEKLPPKVLNEDEKLLMYYDIAPTRLGEE